MRLGLVVYGSLETLSGGYLYDRMLVAYLRAQGDTVEVISIPWKNYAVHLSQNFSRALADRLARLEVDLLLQDELNHPSLFWRNRRLRGQAAYPLVSIVHHLRSSETHPLLWMPLYRKIEQAYLRSVDGFIFNSQTTRRAAENLVETDLDGIVAYPGGDRFGEGLSEQAIRIRARRKGPLRIVFVGSLIPRKGLHTLIEALDRLPNRDWTLHVVGRSDVDPLYTKRIERQVQEAGLREQVRLLGKLEEQYLQDEWKRCDVLAVPSQYEGFGIVYLEGMRFGLPAIGSTAGAASEIITDGKNGYLVPPEDPLALQGCLERLVVDRELLEQLSLAALERFRAFPTWEESAAAVRRYLQSLLAEEPREQPVFIKGGRDG